MDIIFCNFDLLQTRHLFYLISLERSSVLICTDSHCWVITGLTDSGWIWNRKVLTWLPVTQIRFWKDQPWLREQCLVGQLQRAGTVPLTATISALMECRMETKTNVWIKTDWKYTERRAFLKHKSCLPLFKMLPSCVIGMWIISCILWFWPTKI